MKVAIVILNWNGEAMLRRFLPTVLRYSCDEAEVWVADNASTDSSVQLLREHFPSVKLILLEKNYGFAEGYNKALAQIEAEYFVLLNSDVEVTHHWLIPLVEYMNTHLDVAAYQKPTTIILNMRVRRVALLIVMVTLFAEDVYSIR